MRAEASERSGLWQLAGRRGDCGPSEVSKVYEPCILKQSSYLMERTIWSQQLTWRMNPPPEFTRLTHTRAQRVNVDG